MKNKLFTLLFLVLSVSVVLSFGLCDKAEAASVVLSGSCGTNVTYTLDSDGLLTISGSGAMKDYSYSSNAPWYSKRSSIKTVDISDSVTSIGRYAFYGCSSLTSITIPNSVTSIGDSAFSGCNSLESVYITDIAAWCNIDFETSGANPLCYAEKLYINNRRATNVVIPDGVTQIPTRAFSCDSLKSITIPNSVTSIGSYAFCSCDGLTKINWNATNVADFSSDSCVFSDCGTSGEGITVTFGDSVESIPSYLFYSYTKPKIVSVTIGDSVTSIGYSAFRDCSSLTSVTIGDSVTSIGERAFYGCDSLTSVTIPDRVTSIGGEVFSGCGSLTSVTIGDSVTSIGVRAFSNCSGLTEINWNAKNVADFSGKDHVFSGCGTEGITVTFGDSVEQIPKYVFDGVNYYGESKYIDPKIVRVTIPDSVTSIGYEAFASCDSLESVYITDVAAWCNIDFEDEYANPLYYADKLYINNSLATDVVIPDGVTQIPTCAFSCDSLKSITIPDSVTSIGSYAFSGCDGLTSITIPNSVTSIGDGAFRGCDGLTSVTIPDSVTSIGSYAFYYCDSLRNVTIGDSVTSIGYSAFRDCSSLTSVTIGDSVTSIGDYAFFYCSSLTSVTIPDSVTSIRDCAFYDCDGLTSVTIPDSVTSIGDSAFYDCDGLTSVTIGDSVTSIGYSAFRDCSSLTKINWNAKKVAGFSSDDGVFLRCGISGKGITVTFGDSVESIPSYLFYSSSSSDHSKIVSITIGNSVTSIGDYAFEDCDGLTSITIPDSVTSIGDYAFYHCSKLTSVYITDVAAWCNIKFGDYYANPLYWARKLYLNNEPITELVIPDSVTSIREYAFYCCSGLKTIIIPDTVYEIDNYAFCGCNSLSVIEYGGSETEWSDVYIGTNNDPILNAEIRFNSALASDPAENELTIKQVESAESGVYTFSVLPEKVASGCFVYAAAYSENGKTKKLIGMSKTELLTDGETKISVNKDDGIDFVVMFVWTGENNPVSQTGKVNIS